MRELKATDAIRANTPEEYNTLIAFFKANGITNYGDFELGYFYYKINGLVGREDNPVAYNKYNSLADYFNNKPIPAPKVLSIWRNDIDTYVLRNIGDKYVLLSEKGYWSAPADTALGAFGKCFDEFTEIKGGKVAWLFDG